MPPEPVVVSFQRVDPRATLPRQAHDGDAGMDLAACESRVLAPGEHALVRTGLKMEMPANMEAQVRPRSGLALKQGVTVLNAPGTIDAGYRGEIGVILINHGQNPFLIDPGMRIAQLVFALLPPIRIQETQALRDSHRGTGGFGSTGT